MKKIDGTARRITAEFARTLAAGDEVSGLTRSRAIHLQGYLRGRGLDASRRLQPLGTYTVFVIERGAKRPPYVAAWG